MLKRQCGLPKQVHPFWKFCELYDPSQGTIGILHNLCKTAKSVWLPQQMANRLFRLFCGAFFFPFFFLFCFVLFLVKHLSSPNNIPTEIMWIGRTGHSNPEFAECYNPSGAVERERHHGHKLSTLRLERL